MGLRHPRSLFTVTPAVTAALYSAGNCVGGLITLPGILARDHASGLLESLCVTDKGNQKAALNLFLFDSKPAASTFTDKGTFTIDPTDLPRLLAVVSVAAADYLSPSGNTLAAATYGVGSAQMGKQLFGNGAGDLYLAVQTTGTPTYASTSDLQFRFGVVRD